MTTVLRLRNVTLPGGGYPALVSFFPFATLPAASNMLGAYTFSSTATALVNLANPQLPLSAVGNPTLTDSAGAALTFTSFFDTHITPTTEMTLLTLARPQIVPGASSAPAGLFISNFDGSGGDSIGAWSQSRFGVFGGSTAGFAIQAINISAANQSEFNLFAGTFSGAGGVTPYWARGGEVLTAPQVVAGARLTAARSLRIGSHYAPGAFQGPSNIRAAIIYSRALTPAEIATSYAQFRAWNMCS